MSHKFTILNMSYQTPQTKDTLNDRTVSRYRDYRKRRTAQQNKRNAKTPDQFFFEQQNYKKTIYQQYKKQEYYKKVRYNSQKLSRVADPASQSFMHLSAELHSANLKKDDHEHSKIEKTNSRVPFHSTILHASNQQNESVQKRRCYSRNERNSKCTSTSRVRFNANSTSNPETATAQPKTQRNSINKFNMIGILGVRTSFIDKYRLKYENPQNKLIGHQEIDQESTERSRSRKMTNRRELLCSTKRNRTIERYNKVSTAQNTRMNRNQQQDHVEQLSPRSKKNYLSIQMTEKLQCRPWSPSKQEDF